MTCIGAPQKSKYSMWRSFPLPDLTATLHWRGGAHSSLLSYEEINVWYFLSGERGVYQWKCYWKVVSPWRNPWSSQAQLSSRMKTSSSTPQSSDRTEQGQTRADASKWVWIRETKHFTWRTSKPEACVCLRALLLRNFLIFSFQTQTAATDSDSPCFRLGTSSGTHSKSSN